MEPFCASPNEMRLWCSGSALDCEPSGREFDFRCDHEDFSQ